MISEISGQRMVFRGRVLLVPDSQREAVDAILRSCGCRGDWSIANSTVETYNDSSGGSGVSAWSMSLANEEDAQKVQSALNAVE